MYHEDRYLKIIKYLSRNLAQYYNIIVCAKINSLEPIIIPYYVYHTILSRFFQRLK